MKKILLSILSISLFLTTGCFKRDTMDDIDIYTTIYPINYIVSSLYKDNGRVHSIYPNGVDVTTYELTNKQIEDYSNSDLFVFNSRDRDLNYAVEMINKNKNLKIIDVCLGMEYTYSIEELWLDPYNYLMMAQNVKTSLFNYIDNPYLEKEITDNYDELKLEVSELDASLKETVSSSTYNTIVVDNNLFKYLEKYNLNIISLDEDNDANKDKTLDDVKKLINNGSIKYVFTIDDETNETVKNLISKYNIELVKINAMRSVDGGISNSNENYITIMKENINALKRELYK